MEKPTLEQIAISDEMLYLRGKIMTGYGQVEFFLADLSVKLNLKFPYLIKDRIKAAKEIADRPDYAEFRDELNALCDELIKYDDLRHFMAHGMVMLTTDLKGQHLIEMRRYQREDGSYKRYDLFTDLPYLRVAADYIAEYAGRVVGLFQRMYVGKQLEN